MTLILHLHNLSGLLVHLFWLNKERRWWLNLQKAGILCTQEKPLDAQQRIFGNLNIFMVQQFHCPFLSFEVSHNYPPSWMALNELWQIEASNGKCSWISGRVQNCNKDPQDLQSKFSVHQSCIVIVFNVIYHNTIAIQWLYTTWLTRNKQKIKRGLNNDWITDTWKSFSSKFVMLSLQNAGSLCIGDQSRWPRRTSCLYLSNELNFLMLSFSPSSSWLRASKRSYRK